MSPTNKISEVELLEQISPDFLWETTNTLAQWVRHSGTGEEREAFEYLEQTLAGYGLQTTLFEHPGLVSYPLGSSLELIDQNGQVSHSYSSLGTAFGAAVERLEAEVIDLGYGRPEDYQAQVAAGKIVLLNGLATPAAVYRAEQAGSLGQIFINDDHRHYMIVSTIWGTPTPDSAGRLPTTPSLSVTAEAGHDLRDRIEKGPVRVRLRNEVFTAWQTLPLLIAELAGSDSDDFVLFSGHVDSWEVGAMDNGSANAVMVEIGRILAQQQAQLYRGLRLAFWSGHSHGRYAGSTWYADNFWEELNDRCVAHVNIDSPGAQGATFYTSFPANLELAAFGAGIIEEHTGQQARGRRMSRAGDMSFNGIGLPAMFMGVSQVPFNPQDTDYVSVAFGKLLGSKMPWWWHTSADTIDKIDRDILALDAKIYLSTVWRLCHRPLLPMDFRPVVADIESTLEELQAAAGSHLDLDVTAERARRLAGLVAQLEQHCAEAKEQDPDQETVGRLNRQLKTLSRLLIPLTYTAAGRFEHDPAWGQPHLPTLSQASELARLDPTSDAYHFLKTQLVRSRNQANFVLREAIELFSNDER